MLLEQPTIEFFRRIGPGPTIVADARVLVILRMSARGLQRLDHFLRPFDLDGGVGGTVEAPTRNILDLLGLRRVAAAADRNNGGPALRILGRQTPRAVTAHG